MGVQTNYELLQSLLKTFVSSVILQPIPFWEVGNI